MSTEGKKSNHENKMYMQLPEDPAFSIGGRSLFKPKLH